MTVLAYIGPGVGFAARLHVPWLTRALVLVALPGAFALVGLLGELAAERERRRA